MELQSPKKRLYLIDGSGFIFRAYHAIQQPMTRSDGTPVKAVYGFVNMMLKLMEGHQADSFAVIFDAGRQTFRNRLYPEYKAHRPPPPDDLLPQFALVREATEAMNIPSVELADYEADDLIATYTRLGKEAGMEVVIVSSDKDLMQLIDGDVSMFDGMKQKTIGHEEVREKFGVDPDKVRHVLAMIGDTSDNIPGIPGIGPKTAAEIITQFGDLETALSRADEIKQRARREAVILHADKARLSYELIGLCDTVPPPLALEALELRASDNEKLLTFVRHMEFKSLVKRLEDKFGVTPEPAAIPVFAINDAAFELVTDEQALGRWINAARRAGRVAFSTQATSMNAVAARIIGIALSVEPSKACYIPLNHLARETQNASQTNLFDSETATTELVRAPGQLDPKTVYAKLTPLFADPAVIKIGYNVKADMLALANDGVSLNPTDDVMLLSYALDAGRFSHNLADLAVKHLEHQMLTPESVTGTGKNRQHFAEIDPAFVLAFAAGEANVILRLGLALKAALFTERLVTLYETVERPLSPVIAAMERRGIKVDPAQLSALSKDFGERMTILEEEIYRMAGESFNIGSPKQLGEILFDKLGLAGGKKSSKTGSYSTGAEVLEELAEQGEALPARILDWRQLSKLKNTYTDALAHEIRPESGRVHTSFAMAATTTGRLSSNSPNLQNIPIRSDEGRKIRHAFVADAGHVLISADYSQIELRLLADMADITPLKAAFRNGQDIHAITASQMFGVPVEGVSGDLRRKAKTINFGIIYGISAHGLATRLGIGRSEAATYINAYFEQYPGIKAYMERTKLFAREHGYVTTLFGRRCHVPGIADRNPSMRSFSERAAINAPLQGTAADIIKRAMVGVERHLTDGPSRMLLQVHDELVIETPESAAAGVAANVKRIMESAAHLSVPLTVDTSIGKSWGK